jgi:hypothetical protein
LQKLQQLAMKCNELRVGYFEWIPNLIAVAFFLSGRTKDLSAPHCILGGSIKTVKKNRKALVVSSKDTVLLITIGAYRFCQIRTKCCPTFCSQC